MARIVSMIASATEIVHALGQFGNLVGRSHECDFPPEVEGLPVATAPRIPVGGTSAEIDAAVKQSLCESISIYEVFDDVLERLAPTHILTQIQCDVCAVSLRDVERSIASRLPGRPQIVSLQPNSLADIRDDIRRVACALDIGWRGEAVVAGLEAQMGSIACEAARARSRPRLASIEWIEPLMAAGNWHPELVEMAASVNVFGEPGRHSPWMSWEELRKSDPDVILVAACGFDLKRTRSELYWLTGRSDWNGLRAVRDRRVYLGDGNRYFNRPGPRVIESLRALAEILHPDRFAPELHGIAWEALE